MSAARSCPVCDGRVRACLLASPSWGLREVWCSMAALILLLLKHYDPLKENRKVLSLSEYKLQKSRSFPILNTPHLIHSNLLCKKGSHVKPSIYTFFSHHLHFFRTKPSQRIKCYFAMGIKKKTKTKPSLERTKCWDFIRSFLCHSGSPHGIVASARPWPYTGGAEPWGLTGWEDPLGLTGLRPVSLCRGPWGSVELKGWWQIRDLCEPHFHCDLGHVALSFHILSKIELGEGHMVNSECCPHWKANNKLVSSSFWWRV